MSQQPLDPTIKKFYDVRRSEQNPLLPRIDREEGTLFYNGEPTITVLLSGGGIRSMESSVHFVDFLKRDGILDNVQTVGGVSGGSWACIVGGMAGERSRFHTYYREGDAHPWSREYPNVYIEDTIDNDHPLAKMLSPEKAAAAREAVIRGSPGPYNVTVFGDLVIKICPFLDGILAKLGCTRKDVNQLFNTISGDRRYSTLMNFTTMLGYQLLGEERDDKHHPLHQVTENDLPLFLAAAVEQRSEQGHQWFAFDGLGKTGGAVRGLDPHSSKEQDLSIRRTELNHLSWRSSRGKKYFGVFPNEGDFDLTAHRVIGICGSALGIEEGSMKFLDAEGFRAQVNKNATKEHFAKLVDGAASNNVPFPFALKGCQELQEHNIAIVLDNSYGACGPVELRRAVEKGYFHPMCNHDELQKEFFSDMDAKLKPTVKIFFPATEYQATEPIIIYAMGDVKQFTSRFDRTLKQINDNRNYIRGVAELVRYSLELLLQLTSKDVKDHCGVFNVELPSEVDIDEIPQREQEPAYDICDEKNPVSNAVGAGQHSYYGGANLRRYAGGAGCLSSGPGPYGIFEDVAMAGFTLGAGHHDSSDPHAMITADVHEFLANTTASDSGVYDWSAFSTLD